jgi:hypothetical protein
MTVRLLDPADPQWSEILDGVPHDVYHLPEYVRLSSRTTEPGDPRALVVQTSSGPWLLPLVLRDVPGAPGVRDAVTPYGYPGPVGALGADAASAAAEFLRDQHVVTLFARLHPLLDPDREPFTGVGELVEHGETVTIDLSLPDEELWRQTRSRYRSEINRAQRLGHRAYVDDGFVHLDRFMELYAATMERVEASPYYLFGAEYFAGLKDALDASLHLCVVEIDGEIAAGTLFTEVGGLVQYHLSASDDRFSADRPTKTLIHFARAWAKARGNRWLHLGGGLGGERDSLFHFKAGFSKLSQPFRTWRVVTDEPTYVDLVRSVHPTSDGRDRAGFFPEYRRPVV